MRCHEPLHDRFAVGGTGSLQLKNQSSDFCLKFGMLCGKQFEFVNDIRIHKITSFAKCGILSHWNAGCLLFTCYYLSKLLLFYWVMFHFDSPMRSLHFFQRAKNISPVVLPLLARKSFQRPQIDCNFHLLFTQDA